MIFREQKTIKKFKYLIRINDLGYQWSILYLKGALTNLKLVTLTYQISYNFKVLQFWRNKVKEQICVSKKW